MYSMEHKLEKTISSGFTYNPLNAVFQDQMEYQLEYWSVLNFLNCALEMFQPQKKNSNIGLYQSL